MTRVALIGSTGQLGSDIARLWPDSSLGRRGDELIELTHADIEVTDPESVHSVLNGVQPSLVINTAAYIRVDDCETDTLNAFMVNGMGTKYVAEACRDLGCSLVHFSTDYVFDGRKTTPYLELDATSPESAYGITKRAGEAFVRYILPEDHLLVRSSGLYGFAGASGKGGNFVETMLRLAREGRSLRVVDDQTSCPTYTLDLAETLLTLIEREARGLFHVTNAGGCTWYDFARAIFEETGLTPDLSPTTTEEYGLPAKRPAYSILANTHLKELGVAQPREWREALADYLRAKGHVK
jgi:dTDP-4-dehydrorhamnose reductase